MKAALCHFSSATRLFREKNIRTRTFLRNGTQPSTGIIELELRVELLEIAKNGKDWKEIDRKVWEIAGRTRETRVAAIRTKP